MGSNPRLDCPVTDNLVGTFITYNFNLLLATKALVGRQQVTNTPLLI